VYEKKALEIALPKSIDDVYLRVSTLDQTTANQ